ncbi:hypothetical protein ACHAXA_000856 [Cyclostephanos tholiformis]|uniref:Uncharacterized protein n=1 Tax=Cyclostephanos tholiformis TaxID=382380 RepID=A0ABD3SRR4_9STRA
MVEARWIPLAIVAATSCPLMTNNVNAAIIAARSATVASSTSREARGASSRERFRLVAKMREEKSQTQGARKLGKSGKSSIGKSAKSVKNEEQSQQVIIIYLPTTSQQTTSPIVPISSMAPMTDPPTTSPTTAQPTTSNPTGSPTVSPSAAPTSSPTVSPTTIMPTNYPSFKPTEMPSSPPSFGSSVMASNVASIIPTASVMISNIPTYTPTSQTVDVTTVTPTYNLTTDDKGEANNTTIMPTKNPTYSSMGEDSSTPTSSPANSEAPTAAGTPEPTAEAVEVDDKREMEMSLFGEFDDTLLNRKQKKHYQTQTASYIEDFYNKVDDNSGLLDAIKSEIKDVRVVVKVVDQEFLGNGNRKKEGKGRKGSDESSLNAADLVRTYTTRDDDEYYLPEFAIPNNDLDRHGRSLKASTDVNEPCVASSSDPPLALTNYLEITYQIVGPVPDDDLVISLPFSAMEFREDYINNYLKTPPKGDDDDVASVFDSLYCTSRVKISPTSSPIIEEALPTGRPTLSESFIPTTSRSSLTTTPTFSTISSSLPTTADTEMISTISPTLGASNQPASGGTPGPSPTAPTVVTTSPTTGDGKGTLTPSMPTSTGVPGSTTTPTLGGSMPPASGSTAAPTPTTPTAMATASPTGDGKGTLTPSMPNSTGVPGSTTTPTLGASLPPGTTPPPANGSTDTLPPGTTLSPAIGYGTGTPSITTSTGVPGSTRSPTFGVSLPPGTTPSPANGSTGTLLPGTTLTPAIGDRTGTPSMPISTGIPGSTRSPALGVSLPPGTTPSPANGSTGTLLPGTTLSPAIGDGTGTPSMPISTVVPGSTRSPTLGVSLPPGTTPSPSQANGSTGTLPPGTTLSPAISDGTGTPSMPISTGVPGSTTSPTLGVSRPPLSGRTMEPSPTTPTATASPTDGDGMGTLTPSMPTSTGVPGSTRSPTLGASKPPSSGGSGVPISKAPTLPPMSGSSAPVPTVPTALTSSPTLSDDIFDAKTRMIDPEANERHCNDNLKSISREASKEFEVSFVYGVESNSEDDTFVDEIESLILDLLATSMLRCSGEGEAQAVPLRTRGGEILGDVGVVRIRYPEYGKVTSISNCDPVTSSQAQECAILNTKLLVTSIGVPILKVRADMLTILSDAFRENIFLELIPELSATSYLGPDPDALVLSAETEYAMNAESGASKGLIVAFSFGCALLLLKLIFCVAFPRAPKVAYGKIMSNYRSKGQVPSPACNDEFEEERDEPPRGAPLVVSLLQRIKEARQRFREERSP